MHHDASAAAGDDGDPAVQPALGPGRGRLEGELAQQHPHDDIHLGGGQRRADTAVRTTAEGERWVVYINATNHLPALVEGTSASGELLERYVFRNLQANPADLQVASSFDSEARWGPAKGLFGRLARSNAAESRNR